MEPLNVAELPDGALLLLDSTPIIYFLEHHPKFGPIFKPLFEALAERYRATLESWQMVDLNADIAANAARLRASLQLKLADAVQAASAIAINAAALVTHDRDFSRLRSLRVLPSQ